MHPSLAHILQGVSPIGFGTAICAHRGDSSNAPENTLSAFRRAVEVGAQLVEMDLKMTADEELVIFHDTKVDRTTDGKGPVRSMTLSQLRELSAGSWFGDDYSDERIPTVPEMLDCLRGAAVPMLDVKEKLARVPALPEVLVQDLTAAGMIEKTIIICRERQLVQRLHALNPHLPLAYLAIRKKTALGSADELPVSGIVVWWRIADKGLVRRLHRRGVFVVPWTVNQPSDLRYYVDCQTDAIITDCPQVLKDVLEKAELDRATTFLGYRNERTNGG